ncbi:MAG: FAD-binding protein [Gemmatimonadetes bacterium]|nr:FAD-binding protein [Gemmatimonadota bacterium]
MTIPGEVMAAVTRIVGPAWVRRSRSELDTYASDGLPTRHSRPGAVVLPGSRDEVIALVRTMAQHRIPFVARGAGTGLSGGALAGSDAVTIVLTRLTRILEIDAANRRAVVEPGVVNVRLTEATTPFGLHYAPDPSSQTACTLGGNVAENAGGPHCLKYGVTSNHILELEVVLPSGEVATIGSPSGEPWGADLVGLFVGSEGMFGIATRIEVRLTPIPGAIQTLLAGFDTVRGAGEAVSAIIAAGIVPAALEMMDQQCVAAVEASVYAAGYPTDVAAVLLIEVDGREPTAVAAEADAVQQIIRDHGTRTIRSATEAGERARLWQGRKKAFGALGRISRDLVVQDAVVPRSALPDILEEISSIAAAHRVTVSNVFHAGDGNLHPNINFDSRDPDQLERVEAASTAIMQACIRAGGSITGEHGVGMDKLRYMPMLFDSDTLSAMRAVRQAFDPHELSNPGKVVPIHACREWMAAAPLRRAEVRA